MNTMQTKVLNARFKGDKDEKHICPMPLDLIERCITLYSNPWRRGA
jgi:DNA modification methylase